MAVRMQWVPKQPVGLLERYASRRDERGTWAIRNSI
jgi:hypothetical protein